MTKVKHIIYAWLLTFAAFSPVQASDEIMQDIHPELFKQAEDHIIERVGKEFYLKNYTFLREASHCHKLEPEKTPCYDIPPNRTSCSLQFEYLPMSRLIGQKARISITAFNQPNTVKSRYIADTDGKGRGIEPTITKEKALEILQEQYDLPEKTYIELRKPSGSPYGPQGFSWRISYEVENNNTECFDSANYDVNISTGHSTDAGISTVCF